MTDHQLTLLAVTPSGLDPRELAWAAGLFEGEGSIGINKPYRSNRGGLLRVSVTNTDRDVVEFFHDRWEGSVGARKTPGGSRDAWIWVTQARKAERFLLALLPYFATERVWTKAQFALCYQGAKRHSSQQGPGYLEGQLFFYQEMLAMNQRGAQG
jgi:hypothetical protein